MTWVHRAVLAGFGFGVGASIGSFLNVCVWRLPRGESLIHPPSRCPRCDARIAARDNVPVLGWLWLRGRCRHCAGPIAARYVLVETAAGLLFALAACVADPFDGDPIVTLSRVFYHWSLISLLITTSLMAHDRLSAPERLVPRIDSALVLTPALAIFATTAATIAILFSVLAGDFLGAALNAALLAVFRAEAHLT